MLLPHRPDREWRGLLRYYDSTVNIFVDHFPVVDE